jgi:hypothetical protein
MDNFKKKFNFEDISFYVTRNSCLIIINNPEQEYTKTAYCNSVQLNKL